MKQYILITTFFITSLIYPVTSSVTYRDWLDYAHTDLEAAHVLSEHGPELHGPALYHAAQAIEKALKGYLCAHHTKFELTHSLTPLAKQCAEFDASFLLYASDIKVISPFCISTRYPSKRYQQPSSEQVYDHVGRAHAIVAFIDNQLA